MCLMERSAFLLSCVAMWKMKRYVPPAGAVKIPDSASIPPPALQ